MTGHRDGRSSVHEEGDGVRASTFSGPGAPHFGRLHASVRASRMMGLMTEGPPAGGSETATTVEYNFPAIPRSALSTRLSRLPISARNTFAKIN